MPTRPSNSLILFIAATLVTGSIFFGCQSTSLSSYWLPTASLVGGAPDWWNLPAFPVKELSGRVVIANDSNTLYLGIYSSDRHLAGRLKTRGLTLWLSNPRDSKQRVGVHYPLGMDEGGPGRAGHYLPNADFSPGETADMLKLQNDDVEIISGDTARNGRRTPSDAELQGVNARFVDTPQAGEYMLRVDMGKLAAWIRLGGQALVEIDSPAMDHSRRRGGEDREEGGGRWEGGGLSGGRGGGMGGGGGHRHGGENGEHGGRGGEDSGAISPTKAIHFKYVVNLANPPAKS